MNLKLRPGIFVHDQSNEASRSSISLLFALFLFEIFDGCSSV